MNEIKTTYSLYQKEYFDTYFKQTYVFKFEQKILKNRVVVYARTYFNKEKYKTHRIYRYPLLKEYYKNRYLSWENLAYCGGWGIEDDDYLKSAVQEGKKLVANFCANKKEKLLTKDEAEQKNMGVLVEELPFGQEDNSVTYFKKGTLANYYNLDEVINSYKLLCFLPEAYITKLKEVFSSDIESIVKGKFYDNIYNPNPTYNYDDWWQLIVTGLLLGYPLESTAAILDE